MLESRNAKAWVLALASAASFMVILDAMVVATALSTIRLDLGASIEELEWTVNAYNLSFAVLLLTGAALGDRFGRRRMFAAGLGLFVAASAARFTLKTALKTLSRNPSLKMYSGI
jgi:MFS family permease